MKVLFPQHKGKNGVIKRGDKEIIRFVDGVAEINPDDTEAIMLAQEQGGQFPEPELVVEAPSPPKKSTKKKASGD